MTTNGTSSSDRYEAARKALAIFDAPHPDDEHAIATARVTAALRALVEPPATLQTPEQIAEAFAADLLNRGTVEVLGGFPLVKAGDGGKRWNIVYGEAHRQGVLAGIQAAWESWEPESAPGLVPEPVDAQRIAGWRADMESGDTDRLLDAFWAMLEHIEEGAR